MKDSVPTVSIEQLLAHRAWVRALARRLVSSDAEADDVEQDTWLAALRSPPREGRVRGWLAKVVHNAVRQRARSDGRRAHWEGRLDAPAPVDAAVEVVARAEMHQRLVRAVMALDEPYRATVLLRFFDELPPREVAVRLGVPVETVRTRTRRALMQLRHRLDREHDGDRRAWCLALLPLAKRAELTATAGTMGVLAMGAATKWVAGGAVVILLAGLAWQTFDDPAGPVPASEPPAEQAARPGGAGDPPERARVRTGTPPPEATTPEIEVPVAAETRTVRVTLHDEHGEGLRGADVLLVSGDEVLGRGVTRSTGEVGIEAPDGALRVVASPALRPLVIGRIGAAENEVVLHSSAGHEIAGVLRVDGAAPPPRTWIRLALSRPHTVFAELPASVWKALGRDVGPAKVGGHVGPEGRFHFRGLPHDGAATILLHVATVERESGQREVPVTIPDRTVVIDAVTLPIVRGRVVNSDGSVASDAHVWLRSEGPKGQEHMGFRASADGRFEVRMADVACTSAVLQIVGSEGVGWREVPLDPPPRGERDLGDVALSETRRVEVRVHAAGRPVEGAVVVRQGAQKSATTKADGTTHVTVDQGRREIWVGGLGFVPVLVTVEAGEAGPLHVRLKPDTLVRIQVLRHETENPPTGLFVIASVPEGSVGRSFTDADGAAGATGPLDGARRGATWLLEPDDEDRLIVAGLSADAEVRIALVDVTGVVHAEQQITPMAGRPVDLEFAELTAGRMLAGTVLGPGGTPVDAAHVSVAVSRPGAPATDLPRWIGSSLSTTTDAEGRYSLGPIHAERASLRVIAAGLATAVVPRVGKSGPDVTLSAAQEVTVRVVDDRGTVVSDAVVSFSDPELGTYPEPPRARLARRTDEGTYTLRDVPPRIVEIAVKVAGVRYQFEHDGRKGTARFEVPSAVDGD